MRVILRAVVALGVAAGVFWATIPGASAQPAAPEKPVDLQAAQAEFDAARKEMKRLVGEMQVLGGQYKNETDNAKRDALEVKFEGLKPEAEKASDQLEKAAFTLVAANPASKAAREMCTAVVTAAMQGDDPDRALELADLLDTAGVFADPGDAEKGVAIVAATAAIFRSEPDRAAAWLKKAAAAGVEDGRIVQLERSLAAELPKVEAEMAARDAEAKADDLPRVKITTTKGDIVVELFENEAPNTVANFISLVENGTYAGTPFHRVIGGFMAQGGDPKGTGAGGPGYAIACECYEPGARKHFRGSLSMAHAGKDTGGSQFFLTFRPTEHLDGKHTVFGRIIEGMDVLPKLIRTQDPVGQTVPGIKPDRIVKAEVIRKRDHEYKPETLPDPKKGG